VEQLAGNAKRLRQLRYPVSMCDDDDDVATCQRVSAVLVYRGKRDAIKAVRRISAQTLAGSIFQLSVCVRIVILCWFAVVLMLSTSRVRRGEGKSKSHVLATALLT